ncbi:LPXTG cell wall anchor domain-containing protein, partial [Listeria monocytogenes]
ISDISSLSNLTSLTRLNLSDNGIWDISALSGLTSMTTLSLTNQQINNTIINYQESIVLPNKVTDLTGALVAPATISDNGVYAAPNITWNLPAYKTDVNYTFTRAVTLGAASGTFSGTVTQPLEDVPTKYQVIFDVDGVESGEQVDEGSLIIEPEAPTKEGYTFTGWYDAKTGGNKWDFSTDTMPAQDLTLYAQFSVNSYQATFDVDGTTTEETIVYQGLLREPEAPMKEGYTFTGWYDAKTGGNKWDFTTNTMPARDFTLYAQFSVNSYQATFDVDGTTTEESVAYQALLTEPTAPTKEGYTFTGWYDAKTGGTKWDFTTNTMPARDLTLYAQFSVNSYQATFDVDGATTEETVDYQALLTEPTAPTKEGYTFTGWYDAKTGGTKWDFTTNTMPARDLTLYAQFSVNSYQATFDVDGTTTEETVAYQELLTEPEAPTKDGYTFTGWYDAKTGGTKWDFTTNTMPARNLTLYAQFSVNSYQATFDVDGTTFTEETVAYQELLTEPTEPTKEGYTFTGWYDEQIGGTEWNFSTNVMPARDLTLYAQFSINSYQATFDVDGTTTEETVTYQELLTEPEAPTKEGYTFTGWYDAKTGGTEWDFSVNTMPARDLTLYAQFSINSYQATFDVDGTTTEETVDYQGLLTEPTAPTKEGYAFTGWYDAKIGGTEWNFSTNVMPAHDITLYAQFSVNSYQATFDVDGTTTEETVAYQELLTEPAAPTKEGYTFTGWYDAETGGNKWDFSVNTMPARDLTLYAQFSVNSYQATFDVDGTTTEETVDYQGLLTEPTAPTKEGYTFTGWYDAKTGGNKWDFTTNTMPARDLTLYAQFSVNSYQATFDVDGTTTEETVAYQELLTEPTAPTKEGYTFTGWYDAKTGGNKWDFTANTMPARDLTLYAQFSVNNYQATFDVDGTTTEETVAYQELLTEPTAPTKEGYTFTGWYDAKTGGTKWDFTTNTMPARDITLYAQFSVNTYQAAFDVDGTTYTEETVTYQSLLTEPVEPTKADHTFIGWYDAKTGGNKWDFSTDRMPARDITLYAQFSANSYQVTFDMDGTTTEETVAYQGLLTEPTAPTKEGYTFTGWYDAKTGGNKWDFSTDTMPAHDLTLYAQFSAISYQVSFEVNGTITEESVAYQELLTEPEAPTKEGYTFTGWYDAETGGNKWDFSTDTMPAHDLTLYAQFSMNSYKTTFNVDGTTTEETVAYQELLTEPTAPTKEGYTFTGWYDAKTGGTEWDFSTDTMPAHDLTLYAQFSINNYTATFDVDGKTTTQTVNYHGLLTKPTDPTKEGYTFTGWYDAKIGGNKWDFNTNTMPAENLTLYAQFSKDSSTDGGNNVPGQGPDNRPDSGKPNNPDHASPIVQITPNELPKMGDSSSFSWTLIGIAFLSFGTLLLVRRKKKAA